MRRSTCLLLLLLLVACGGEQRRRGSLDWDAGTGVLEITGTGAFVLELNNNGTATVEILPPDDTAPRAFAPGQSLRLRARAPYAIRLDNPTGRAARIDYVLKGDVGVRWEHRIE